MNFAKHDVLMYTVVSPSAQNWSDLIHVTANAPWFWILPLQFILGTLVSYNAYEPKLWSGWTSTIFVL